MKKIILSMTGLMALAPAFAFAANQPGLLVIMQTKIAPILNGIIPLLITVAVIYFVWGIVMYVIADDEEAKKKGKDRILYGLIGLFVIVTFWGLVEVIQNTIGVTPGLTPEIYINPDVVE